VAGALPAALDRGNENPERRNEMTMAEYPAFDRMAERGEMIVNAQVIHGPVSLADLREYLSHVLPEGYRIDHDDATGELVIRTGLELQLGGELALLETED
jgi:hypothetical protein